MSTISGTLGTKKFAMVIKTTARITSLCKKYFIFSQQRQYFGRIYLQNYNIGPKISPLFSLPRSILVRLS
jgi:hypothetical protein